MNQNRLEANTPRRNSQTVSQLTCWALYGLSGALLVPFWWLLAQIFLLQELSTLNFFLAVLVWLIWLATVVFGLIMAEQLDSVRLFLGLSLGSLSLFAFFPLNVWLFLAVVSFLTGLFLLRYRFVREDRFSIRFSLRRVLPRVLPPFFTWLSLAVALIYFASPLLNQDLELALPKPIFNIVVAALPFQEEIQALGISQAELYQQLNQSFQSVIAPYRSVVPLFFVLGVALTLKALSYPVIWILVLVEGVFLQLALKFGLIHKERRLVVKEVFRF